MNMWKVTVGLGMFLEVLGIGTYLAALAGWTGGKASITALIPAAFGSIFVVLGFLAAKPDLRKHVMHAAAALALLGGAGSLVKAIQGAVAGFPKGMWPPGAQAVMGVACLAFVGLCVQSFIAVRRAKASA
jgi:hypothetical protein